MTELDESTGMPQVPDGYFFRVKKFDYIHSAYTMDVQLRKRIWIWSRKVGASLSKPGHENVSEAARRAMNKAAEFIAKNETIHDRDRFLGDYPPKRLEDQ